MGKVIAVCISKEKGTQKYRIPEGEFIEEWGLKDDAHAGKMASSGQSSYLMTRSRSFVQEVRRLRMEPLGKIW